MIVRYQRSQAGPWHSFPRTGSVLLAVILAPRGCQGRPVVAVETQIADRSDRAAQGPAPDSSDQPALLHRRERQGDLLDGFAHLGQPPGLLLCDGTLAAPHGLRRLSGVLEGPQPQLLPVVGLGECLQPGRETGYDPLRPDALRAPGPRHGPGRQTEVRPDAVQPGLLRPDASPGQGRAGDGIYVSVMLFNGFSIEGKGNVGGDPWQGHPLNPENNVNGLDGGGSNGVHTLANRPSRPPRRTTSARSSTP